MNWNKYKHIWMIILFCPMITMEKLPNNNFDQVQLNLMNPIPSLQIDSTTSYFYNFKIPSVGKLFKKITLGLIIMDNLNTCEGASANQIINNNIIPLNKPINNIMNKINNGPLNIQNKKESQFLSIEKEIQLFKKFQERNTTTDNFITKNNIQCNETYSLNNILINHPDWNVNQITSKITNQELEKLLLLKDCFAIDLGIMNNKTADLKLSNKGNICYINNSFCQSNQVKSDSILFSENKPYYFLNSTLKCANPMSIDDIQRNFEINILNCDGYKNQIKFNVGLNLFERILNNVNPNIDQYKNSFLSFDFIDLQNQNLNNNICIENQNSIIDHNCTVTFNKIMNFSGKKALCPKNNKLLTNDLVQQIFQDPENLNSCNIIENKTNKDSLGLNNTYLVINDNNKFKSNPWEYLELLYCYDYFTNNITISNNLFKPVGTQIMNKNNFNCIFDDRLNVTNANIDNNMKFFVKDFVKNPFELSFYQNINNGNKTNFKNKINFLQLNDIDFNYLNHKYFFSTEDSSLSFSIKNINPYNHLVNTIYYYNYQYEKNVHLNSFLIQQKNTTNITMNFDKNIVFEIKDNGQIIISNDIKNIVNYNFKNKINPNGLNLLKINLNKFLKNIKTENVSIVIMEIISSIKHKAFMNYINILYNITIDDPIYQKEIHNLLAALLLNPTSQITKDLISNTFIKKAPTLLKVIKDQDGNNGENIFYILEKLFQTESIVPMEMANVLSLLDMKKDDFSKFKILYTYCFNNNSECFNNKNLLDLKNVDNNLINLINPKTLILPYEIVVEYIWDFIIKNFNTEYPQESDISTHLFNFFTLLNNVIKVNNAKEIFLLKNDNCLTNNINSIVNINLQDPLIQANAKYYNINGKSLSSSQIYSHKSYYNTIELKKNRLLQNSLVNSTFVINLLKLDSFINSLIENFRLNLNTVINDVITTEKFFKILYLMTEVTINTSATILDNTIDNNGMNLLKFLLSILNDCNNISINPIVDSLNFADSNKFTTIFLPKYKNLILCNINKTNTVIQESFTKLFNDILVQANNRRILQNNGNLIDVNSTTNTDFNINIMNNIINQLNSPALWTDLFNQIITLSQDNPTDEDLKEIQDGLTYILSLYFAPELKASLDQLFQFDVNSIRYSVNNNFGYDTNNLSNITVSPVMINPLFCFNLHLNLERSILKTLMLSNTLNISVSAHWLLYLGAGLGLLIFKKISNLEAKFKNWIDYSRRTSDLLSLFSLGVALTSYYIISTLEENCNANTIISALKLYSLLNIILSGTKSLNIPFRLRNILVDFLNLCIDGGILFAESMIVKNLMLLSNNT